MRVLLDTHVFLWWITDNPRLHGEKREAVADFDNEVFLSAASAWEIEIKVSCGKLKIDPNWKLLVEKNGFIWLPVLPRHTEFIRDLPPIHRDPFDRMLVAQAKCEHMVLLSYDANVNSYFSD